MDLRLARPESPCPRTPQPGQRHGVVRLERRLEISDESAGDLLGHFIGLVWGAAGRQASGRTWDVLDGQLLAPDLHDHGGHVVHGHHLGAAQVQRLPGTTAGGRQLLGGWARTRMDGVCSTQQTGACEPAHACTHVSRVSRGGGLDCGACRITGQRRSWTAKKDLRGLSEARYDVFLLNQPLPKPAQTPCRGWAEPTGWWGLAARGHRTGQAKRAHSRAVRLGDAQDALDAVVNEREAARLLSVAPHLKLGRGRDGLRGAERRRSSLLWGVS